MKRFCLLAASAALLAVPAAAHNAWIKPSATVVAGEDGWVTFDAAASTDVYHADHRPLPIDMIKATDPDGAPAPIEHALAGQFRSTFDVHLTRPGTWRIGMESYGVMGSYMLNGEEYRVGGRGPRPGGPGGAPGGPAPGGAAGQGGPGAMPGANVKFVPGGPDFTAPAGATDVKLTLTGSRNEVFVTLGKPSAIKLSGKGLEMEPVTHPADLVADAPGQFRFLVDGKPVAGLEVELIPDGRRFRNGQDAITATTDANGEVTVTWPAAGLYWLHAVFSDDTAPRPGIAGRRFQYAASVEVAAP